jgi:hypothetical protein
MTRKTGSKAKEVVTFREFLLELETAYSLALAFSIDMKVKAVKRLKEKHEQGFVFI